LAARSKEKLGTAKALPEAEQLARLPAHLRDKKWLYPPVKPPGGFAPANSIWFDPESGDRYEANPFGYFECPSGFLLPQTPDTPLIPEEVLDQFCALVDTAQGDAEKVKSFLSIFGVKQGARYPACAWSPLVHEQIKAML
jgi:hypothetical protein